MENCVRRTRVLAFLATTVAVLAGAFVVPSASGASAPPQLPLAAAVAPVCQSRAVVNRYAYAVTRTTADPVTYTSTAWTNLGCGSTAVTVPRGRRALIVATVAAEVECTGAAGQWCLGRVLIGGVDAAPVAAEPSSLAWSHSDPSGTVWESNAFIRSRLVSCPSTSAATRCTYPVVTQVRNHAAGLNNWVDDLTVSVVSTNT